MAKGQWLDALARRLAGGDRTVAGPAPGKTTRLAQRQRASGRGPSGCRGDERDLAGLKLAQDPDLRLRNAD